jgi:hypothetical protein
LVRQLGEWIAQMHLTIDIGYLQLQLLSAVIFAKAIRIVTTQDKYAHSFSMVNHVDICKKSAVVSQKLVPL